MNLFKYWPVLDQNMDIHCVSSWGCLYKQLYILHSWVATEVIMVILCRTGRLGKLPATYFVYGKTGCYILFTRDRWLLYIVCMVKKAATNCIHGKTSCYLLYTWENWLLHIVYMGKLAATHIIDGEPGCDILSVWLNRLLILSISSRFPHTERVCSILLYHLLCV